MSALAAIVVQSVMIANVPKAKVVSDRQHKSASTQCNGSLTGRKLVIDPAVGGFGTIQGLGALPLRPNEYVITFDDGPDPETTPQLLSILRTHCIKAAFMLVGRRAIANPLLVQSIMLGGHAIGSHSNTHISLKRPTQVVEDDILLGASNVEQAAYGNRRGKSDWAMFRLPGGSGVPPKATVDQIAFLRRSRLLVVGYDFSPADWKNDPPQITFARFVKRKVNRGVIVLHDGPSNTPQLLRMILNELDRQGAKVVSLELGK